MQKIFMGQAAGSNGIFSGVAHLYSGTTNQRINQSTKMKHSTYKQLSVISIAAVIVIAGCQSKATETDKTETVAKAAVETIVLKKDKLSSTLDMPGELIAFQQVDLYAKVNSFVKKLTVDVGSEVTAGQLLATMEAPEINSQLSGAESRLKSLEAISIASKANYNRLLETSKTPGTISPNDLDQALARQQSDVAQLDAAKAAYREITDNRNYLEIRAPFSGVITARNVSAGAYVGPSGKGSELPLFTLQEQKKLRLVVAVPEAYSAFLANQNDISFSIRSLPGEKFSAKMQRLAGALDNRLRSQRVEMDVSNIDKKLLPGMVAEISIPMPAKDSSFIVPETALINSAEGIFVIKSNAGKAQWLPVQKGRSQKEHVEVFGVLSAGDSILVHANEEVRNGSPLYQ